MHYVSFVLLVVGLADLILLLCFVYVFGMFMLLVFECCSGISVLSRFGNFPFFGFVVS